VTITATASSGYQFSGFTGTTITSQNPLPVTMNGPVAETANFTAPPALTVSSTHAGDFTQGQAGAVYTLSVSNIGTGGTDGTAVVVADGIPGGLVPSSISGPNWTCTQPAGPCTRSDVLQGGASYPAITLTTNVASNAPSTVTNQVSVSGGGAGPGSAVDPTNIIAPQRYADPMAFATSASVVGGVAETVTITYTDENGPGDILSGVVRMDSCYLAWDRSGNVRLYGSENGQPDAIGVLGQQLSLWAGNCSINLANSALSTPTGNPKALLLRLGVTFPEQAFLGTTPNDNPGDFIGPHEVLASAVTAEGLATILVDLGSVVVSQGQDFALTVSPSTTDVITLSPSATVNVAVSAMGLNGFYGPISLSSETTSGTPACFAVTTNPATIYPGTQATVTVRNNNCPIGSMIVLYIHGSAVVSGMSVRRLGSNNALDIVSGGIQDFTISIGGPSPVTLTPLGLVNYPITISSVNGMSGNVNIGVASVPSGVTCYLSYSQVFLSGWGSTASDGLTCYGSGSMQGGSYPVQIVTSSSSASHSANVSLSTQVTTFQVASATGGAIVHNTGQEVVVTQQIPTANTPAFTTCDSADPDITCRVIGQSTGAVTLGITAAARTVHGTHVVRLNGAGGTTHVAIADDFTPWPTIQVTPPHITEGSTTRVAISGWALQDACGLGGDCVGIPDVCINPGNVNATFVGWTNGTLYEDFYAAPGSKDTGSGSHLVTVDLCKVSWNLDGLLGSDSPTSCVAGPGAVTVDAAPPPNPRILFNGKDVTGLNTKVIVGQQIILTPNADSGTLANQPWSFTGKAVGNWKVAYDASVPYATAASIVEPDLSSSRFQLYWIASGTSTVTLTVKDGAGNSYTANTTFNVVSPTGADIQASALDDSAILIDTQIGYLSLRYGPVSPKPAISFSINPLNYTLPEGFTGDNQWVQVMGQPTQVTRTITNSSFSQTKDCQGMLDTVYPYPYHSSPYATDDSPAQELLHGFPTYNLDEVYTMWYMFRPSLANSIFVPLSSVTWGWKANVQTNDNGSTWAFVSKSARSPVSQITTTFPTWSGNVSSCVYNLHN